MPTKISAGVNVINFFLQATTNYSTELNKISQEYCKLRREYNAEVTRLSREHKKMQSELEKERKEAQNKLDVYKKKTEQFQVQWKKREESEAHLKVKLLQHLYLVLYLHSPYI